MRRVRRSNQPPQSWSGEDDRRTAQDQRAGRSEERLPTVAQPVGNLELRPSVARLPHEVRRPHDERDRDPGQQPRRAQHGSLGDEEKADCEPDDQEARRPLVEEPDAHQQPDDEPQPRVATVEEADDEQRDAAPEQDLGRDRREEVPDRQEHRRDRGGNGCGDLRSSVAAELTGEQRRHDDEPAVEERRDDPEPELRRPEHGVADSVEERRQRRMVDVPPRQPSSAREVVQLVAVIAVDRHGREMEHDDDRGDDPRGSREIDSASSSSHQPRGHELDDRCFRHVVRDLPPS